MFFGGGYSKGCKFETLLTLFGSMFPSSGRIVVCCSGACQVIKPRCFRWLQEGSTHFETVWFLSRHVILAFGLVSTSCFFPSASTFQHLTQSPNGQGVAFSALQKVADASSRHARGWRKHTAVMEVRLLPGSIACLFYHQVKMTNQDPPFFCVAARVNLHETPHAQSADRVAGDLPSQTASFVLTLYGDQVSWIELDH